jgi:hypothetical protein
MTARRARAVGSRNRSGRNTVARTTKGRQEAAPLRQGRFGRGSTGQAQKPRRFARSAGQTEPARRFGRAPARPSGGAPRRRRSQPEQSGAQKLMQTIRGVLPGGRGKSSASSGKILSASMAAVGGLLGSLGGKKGRSRGRARKPAMFGALGAGAAGAAAVVAKRRHASRSSQPAGATRDLPDAHATSTPPGTQAHPAAPPLDETAQEPDTPPDPDTPATGDAR